jgi:hypothetical protein
MNYLFLSYNYNMNASNQHKETNCQKALEQYIICISNKKLPRKCESEFYKKCLWKWSGWETMNIPRLRNVHK